MMGCTQLHCPHGTAFYGNGARVARSMLEGSLVFELMETACTSF